MLHDLHVWLSYVSYPVTTAVYLERALRKACRRVTTVGPRLPEEFIQKWQLQNLKLPIMPHDMDTSFKPDMREIVKNCPASDLPDLFIWVESVVGFLPQNLDALPCPRIGYLIDTHLSTDFHRRIAPLFDRIFLVHRQYVEDLRKINPHCHWLPVACDPEIHAGHTCDKTYEIGFVGSVQPNSRRHQLLSRLSADFPIHYERCFWDDMARLFSRSKIVFNEAVRDDLNMRLFEVLSTGSFLLTDLARNSGQEILFVDGEDCGVYQDGNITDVARFYLENPGLREQIAARGQRLVRNAHTYDHRIEDLLAVSLNQKPDTFSAEELREISLKGEPAIDSKVHESIYISTAPRSFVIPVLDMSPASEYNILTLLSDLEKIDGDVIVIFNGQEVADQLKTHPRITRYAVMKQNIGVARAWNLGLEIAATPTVFILNADLHLEPSSVMALESALMELPDAACVGPQGCFLNFALARDYTYFDKGTFNRPIEVDAVSGFFFCLKLKDFSEKTIRFENGYTPCYLEEWDLGLQIKQAGLKNYIVPTTAYEHHWSGTIRALREIAFYEKAETAGEILLRNRRLFFNKWRGIAARNKKPQLLASGFMTYVAQQARALIAEGRFSDARQWIEAAKARCQETPEVSSLQRFIDIQISKTENMTFR